MNELAPRLFLVSGTGVNTVLFAPAGTTPVVVDAGAADTAAALHHLITGLAPGFPRPVLFNTHWHLEQTGANDYFGALGSRILAQENTRLWMTVPIDCKWLGRTFAPREGAARPNETFYDRGSLGIEGERLDYGYLLQAHTDGDMYVHLRNANVIVAGDVVSGAGYPITDFCTNGSLGAMVAAQKTMLDMANEQTRIIPGRGTVLSRSQLASQLQMMTTIRDRLYDLVKRGMSAEEMVAAGPTREFDAQFGDPELMIRNAARSLADNARQVPGVV
jgi:glyoxylase-like metal-dependent hydrolase (beta-lactamase superfamily II)